MQIKCFTIWAWTMSKQYNAPRLKLEDGLLIIVLFKNRYIVPVASETSLLRSLMSLKGYILQLIIKKA